MASSGSRRPARRRWWAGFSPSHNPLPRPWRGGGHAATPTARSSSTATASPSAAGARRWRTACQSAGVPTRFLHDCRRTAARNLIRASVPERVAMLLTGHKSRAIFDRYNIIHEQELLDAGDQLVEYLAQQAQAVPARQRPHPAGPCHPAHRITPSPRATHHRVRARRTPASRAAGAGHRLPVRRRSRRGPEYGPASDRGTRGNGAGRRGRTRTRAGPDRASRPGGPEAPMLFSEICNLIVLGVVHPASDGEYEKVQRVRHVLRRC